MKRAVFAFAVAALTLAAVSVSQAAPIAPLPAGVSADHGNLTQVRWWGWRHRHWGHRRCWRGPYGRWHCHW